ncbi:DUF3784 domain-containing protein [Evansella halocellulosilytica]|uniref:DUF3784 domain-containing protein n=1 Tax=Evansella halocellulosilytica TaxID=2011013 RepID=UPI000BB7CFAA|nr:DUF3784 domain-containing protein [Evansella halocellulosilytica]
MESTVIVVMTICIPMLLLFIGGYLILNKGMYDLISGYALKNMKEKEALAKRGYPQAVGKVLIYSGLILFIGMLLYLANIPFAVQGAFLTVVVYMFTHLLLINKTDVKKNKVRTMIILIFTQFITISIIVFVFTASYERNEIEVSDKVFSITGYYGDEWLIEDITNVELVDQLPDVQARAHGFTFGHRAKGRYYLEGVGSGHLFVYKNEPPFIFVQMNDEYLFINSKSEKETIEWYDELLNNWLTNINIQQ